MDKIKELEERLQKLRLRWKKETNVSEKKIIELQAGFLKAAIKSRKRKLPKIDQLTFNH